MNIYLYGNDRQHRHRAAIVNFAAALHRAGASLCGDRAFVDFLASGMAPGDELPPIAVVEAAECPADTALALSFGGDGTFLSAAHVVAPLSIPLMGINTGHLGFLAGGSLAEARALIDDIIGGNLVVESRSCLEVSSPDVVLEGSTVALNEIAISKKGTASMLRIEATLDGHHLADYLADGLVIATPTGSTAYNLSVGGPVVDPRAAVMVLSPIAPHTLTQRPLVVADTSVVEARGVPRTPSFLLSIDGRSLTIPRGARLTVSAARRPLLLARPSNHNFTDTLRTKLLWGI